MGVIMRLEAGMLKKMIFFPFILCIAGAVFGQNGDIFNILERLTHNFPTTEDGVRRIMMGNGFILSDKDRYINSFEGVSIESWLEYDPSVNLSILTFNFIFNNDVYFVNFIKEFLAYFSSRYDVSRNSTTANSNTYVFYNESDVTALAMVYFANKKDIIIYISMHN